MKKSKIVLMYFLLMHTMVFSMQVQFVTIAGLDKKELLCALYNSAKSDYRDKNDLLSDQDALMIIRKMQLDITKHVDYVNGRALFINVWQDLLNVYHYNKVNGHEAAQKVIKELKELTEKKRYNMWQTNTFFIQRDGK